MCPFRRGTSNSPSSWPSTRTFTRLAVERPSKRLTQIISQLCPSPTVTVRESRTGPPVAITCNRKRGSPGSDSSQVFRKSSPAGRCPSHAQRVQAGSCPTTRLASSDLIMFSSSWNSGSSQSSESRMSKGSASAGRSACAASARRTNRSPEPAGTFSVSVSLSATSPAPTSTPLR